MSDGQSIIDFLLEIDTEKQGDLYDYVEKMTSYKEEILPPTKDSYFRVSGLNKMCPREECLCSKFNITRTKEVHSKLSRTFAFGRAFEKIFRDDKLGDLGIVVGQWRCLGCGFILE